MIRIDELEALARAATLGRSCSWKLHGPLRHGQFSVICPAGDVEMGTWFVAATEWEHHAAYIAAFSPERALALIQRVRELEAALRPFGQMIEGLDGEPGERTIRVGKVWTEIGVFRRAAAAVEVGS